MSLTGSTAASIDVLGSGNTPVTVGTRSQLPLRVISNDFTLHWRDIETARQVGLPLDLGAAAADHMAAAGFYPPYALVCSPNLYVCMLRVSGSSGVLELTQIHEMCTAGVFQSVQSKSALLMSVGVQNFDLVIGQDLTVAYVRSENMDDVRRVLETMTLRVKRPGAVCSLAPRAASPSHRVRRGVPEEATGVGD